MFEQRSIDSQSWEHNVPKSRSQSFLGRRWADASVVVCVTSKTPQNAKHAIYEVGNNRDDVVHEVDFIPLLDSTGRRKQRSVFVQTCPTQLVQTLRSH